MFGNPSTNGQYPVFVYGTLRQGQQNYDLLRNRTVTELHAHITDMQLYSVGAFPMMVHGNGLVHGDLLELQPFLYDHLLRKLDHNEGYVPNHHDRSLYRRQLVVVHVNATNSTRMAWAYLGQANQIDRGCTHIESGDWVQYRWQQMQKTRFGRYLLETPEERKIPECQ